LPLAYLLTQALPALGEVPGVVVETVGPLPDVRESDVPPTIELSVDNPDDSDWFDLGVTVRFGDQKVVFKELFAALAQGEDRLLLANGTMVRLDHPALDRLRELIDEATLLSDKPGKPRLNRYQGSLWGELEDLADNVDAGQWAKTMAALRQLEGAAPGALDAPATLRADLRPYQHQGFEWLVFLWRHQLGGILADDMGLGKTVEALALIAQARLERPHDPPFLVVAPSSVVGNWLTESARFIPTLTVRAARQTSSKSGLTMSQLRDGADIVVTSYAVSRLDHEEFVDHAWAGLILDEAQFAKNPATKANQQARRIKAPFKLAVTGTPMENSLDELWAVSTIAAPGLLGNRRQFKEVYGQVADAAAGPAVLDRLRRRLRPVMLRRTKELVAPELPPRMEQIMQVDLAPAHRRAYDTHLQRERQRMLGMLADFESNRLAVFRSLTVLRRMALDASLVDPDAADLPSSKLDALMEAMDDVIGSGHRALVFSQFTTYLAKVAARLERHGIAHSYLDGSTTNRPKVIQGFKEGTDPVFLISLKAGGFGLNLTEADYVFLLDPWWNPATEAQAIDRTHRIGQEKPVMVFRLVATDTIEDKVMALKARKAALFDAVLDDDGTFSSKLTATDIKELLG
jgi:SNF2 family DNA or RNA helicase